MVKLAGVFGRLVPFRALVFGDFIFDLYTTGKVKRISPEAPVPVLEVLKEESRAGGAGNVVLNLLALGAEVLAVGRIGADFEGKALVQALSLPGVHLQALFEEVGYQTPVKNRLIADSQQLLRVDRETPSIISAVIENKVLQKLEDLMDSVQVVAISDYGKGFLSRSLLQAIIQTAREKKVPVIVDPKGLDFTKYAGASVIKPNLSEAYAAAKLPLNESLNEVAQQIFQKVAVDHLFITRSEAGISLFSSTGSRSDFPVRSREVKDVTGAGDTVLAMLAMALAHGLDLSVAAQLANIAAGLAIERLGCVQVSLAELAERLLEIDCDTKVFDQTQTYALQKALQGKKTCLLVLEAKQELGRSFFQVVRSLGAREGVVLIIYVPDSHPEDDFIHLLSSLKEVGSIVLHQASLENLCKTIRPEELYVLQKGQLKPIQEGKALLSQLIGIKRVSAN